MYRLLPPLCAASLLSLAAADEPRSALSASPQAGEGATWAGQSGYEMVRVSSGEFSMGSPASEPNRGADEAQHRVRISQDYYVGVYEVTQGLWQEVSGENPSSSRDQFWSDETQGACQEHEGISLVDADYPVMCISWCDAVRFANRLSERDGLSAVYSGAANCSEEPGGVSARSGADGYRLLTEAEWEYAARAGTQTVYVEADEETGGCRYGNVADQTAQSRWSDRAVFSCDDGHPGLAPVGSFQPNGWGLYDMGGNVWEWTWDRYQRSYQDLPAIDPTGARDGAVRVTRGGGWINDPKGARVAIRDWSDPSNRGYATGLRLSRSAE